MNKIIVFANQKGGVGKTTLSILFANYLNWKKKKVVLIDADNQHSASAVRKDDETFMGEAAPYAIQEISLQDGDYVEKVMANAKQFDGTVVIDCPGSISDEGISAVFASADIVVIPFEFEDISMKATTDFIKVLNNVRIKYRYKCELMMVPNKVQLSYGTASEIASWKTALSSYTIAGDVLPKIVHRAQLKRIDTYNITPAQREVVKETFEKIINKASI